jgi:hypothetical protein
MSPPAGPNISRNASGLQLFTPVLDSFGTRADGPGLSNAAPVIYFPGALFYSVGFNVNQNFKKIIFLNNSTFQFFS